MLRRSTKHKYIVPGWGKMICGLFTAGLALSLPACGSDEPADQDEDSEKNSGKKDPSGISPGKSQLDSVNPGNSAVPEPNSNNPLPSGNSSENGNPDQDASDNCGESNFKAQPLPPNVMLVLDKSGSMSMETWKDNGVTKTRWASLHATTEFLLDTFGDKVNFGIKLFPSKQPGGSFDMTKACQVDTGVDVECKEGSAQDILDTLPKASDNFMGNTPTVSGLKEAFDHLASLDDPNAEAAILIVDGRTNCSETNDVLSATAAEAKAKNILVYVVGIDLDNETLASLTPVAVAGGTEKVHNSADSAALGKSLEEILGGITSCVIPLGEQPPYEHMVKVKLKKKKLVPYLKDEHSCEGKAEGWVYTSSKKPFKEIELCGKSCETFLESPEVDVTFECPPPV